MGDAAGVSLRGAAEAFRFAARAEGVADLHFGPEGSLWIASLSGLFELSREGRRVDRTPGPGEGVQAARRIAVSGSLLLVGTDDGAWISADGVSWRRVAQGLPDGPVPVVAIEPVPAAGTDHTYEASKRSLWFVADAAVWRLPVSTDAGRVVLGSAKRLRIPGTPTGVAPVDIVPDAAGRGVAILYPRLLAVSRRDSSDFDLIQPGLPPGARGQRLVAGASRIWLATDQGLMTAPTFKGPWRRSGMPAGGAATTSIAIAPHNDWVLAAGVRGLLHGAPVLRAAARSESAAPAAEPTVLSPTASPSGTIGDPDIRKVQRASLRYLALQPERIRRLHAGLARRGWLPTLSIRLGAGHERERQRDHDEAFVSGEVRRLLDRETERALDFDASIIASWDLGAIAFDGDSIDISREARLLISLRDNVLDEVNQLYFERRGLLRQLGRASSDGAQTGDRELLQLRAAELAAGLDAWTGGWFSQRVARAKPPDAVPLARSPSPQARD